MITVLKTNIDKFEKIIHVADIHIMLTKRHDEYREVFEKFYIEIDNTPKETAIFVVGDVFHNKIDLSPESIQLAKDFLFNLAERRPTVLVAGNHDAILTNKSRLDSLSPVVDAISHPNLFYLKKSGLFSLGDICINNYSVFDSSDKYIKGSDIPSIYRNQYRHFIVLFHGAVDNSMTDLGFRMINKSINTSLFDNHDIALLGDIHLMQTLQEYDYLNNKPAIRYPSSIIQRNHGEMLTGHGYTLWNLSDKSYNHTEIPNDYGFFTIVMDGGKIISDVSNIPKKSRIQFQLHDTVSTEVKHELSKIRLVSDVLETSYSKIIDSDKQSKILSSNGNMALGNINNRNYQTKLLTEYLTKNLSINDKELIDSVILLNDKINNQIKKDDVAKNIRWVPIRFEWENLFSYGDGNVIDFTKLKNVVGLFAANASGKSTLLSALSICIFDKCEREFKAANIMNSQRSTFKCKFEFEIDGVKFFIEREGKEDRKGAVKVNVKFYKIVDGEEIDLVGEARADTNAIIREYLGTYEDFILTALSVQGGKNNVSVIDMGNTDRKDLLAQFMGLSIFDKLYVESNKRLNELFVLLKTFNNDDYTKKITEYSNFLSQVESLYRQETADLETINEQKTMAHKNILEESVKLIKIDSVVPIEESLKKKEDSKNKIEIIKKEIEPANKNLMEVEQLLTDLEQTVQKLDEKDIVKIYFKCQELEKEKFGLQNKWERLAIAVNNEKKIIEKSKEHQYDPNCKFCVSNGNSFIVDREAAMKQLEIYKETATDIKNKIDLNQTELDSLSWTVEGIKIHQTALSKLNSSRTLRNRIIDRLSVIQKTLDNLSNDIIECDKNIDLYNKNINDINTNKNINLKLDDLKLELSNVETLYNRKNKSIMDLNGKILVCKTQIDIINKKIEEAKEIEKEYKIYDLYVKSVNRDGIPFDVIKATVPEVEREVNSILSQITNFTAMFETDGKNVIPYIVYDDKQWLMSLTSGFERFVLSLAIRIALVNISNLPRPSFLIIDEGFGVLDSENLPSMHILFSYLKANFDFILVISHLEALRDMVDMQIEITKDNGFSKINMA